MTARIHSLLRRAAYVATAGALAACGSDATAPIDSQSDAALAAQTFYQLADSVARAGGDADLGAAYAGIAGTLRMGGRLAPIELKIDGTATTFLATASSFTTTIDDCPPGMYCFAGPHVTQLRDLIAFDKQNPRRIVQLSSARDEDPIGAILDPSVLAIYAPTASLVYMDGAGGTFLGTSGTQKFTVTPTKALCPAFTDSTRTMLRWMPVGTCVIADIAVAFDGTLAPSPWALARNSATGTHAIAMATQTVPGTHHELTMNVFDTLPAPPVVVRPVNELPAQLSASVRGNAVTLTFTVKNPTPNPTTVTYPSGQKYDFVVTDSSNGQQAWRWSAARTFVAAITEQSVPGYGWLTFTETWTPAAKGRYLVHALLTSTSHRAEAYASVVVP